MKAEPGSAFSFCGSYSEQCSPPNRAHLHLVDSTHLKLAPCLTPIQATLRVFAEPCSTRGRAQLKLRSVKGA